MRQNENKCKNNLVIKIFSLYLQCGSAIAPHLAHSGRLFFDLLVLRYSTTVGRLNRVQIPAITAKNNNMKNLTTSDKIYLCSGICLGIIIVSALTFNLLTIGFHHFARL